MLRLLVLVLAVVALPALAGAQGTARPRLPVIPEHLMPPTGKCRIWMDGVPAAQQPAPTDCQTALRQKPANGTVIFGPTERGVEASGFRSNPRPSRRDTTARAPTPSRNRPATTRTPPDTTKPPATRRPESAS